MATRAKAKPMTRTLGDNPWLEPSDVQDLTDAVRSLTRFLTQSEQRHQHALNQLSEADVVTQLVQTMKQVRDEVKALRSDMNDLTAAFSAKVGNGHDAHPHD